MHNLAMELAVLGHNVSGSDDEIYNPARDRLKEVGLLPKEIGWNSARITKEIDLVVLGMHAHLDNPELLRAQDLNLKIVSFPEFVGSYTQTEKRIVIAGSHGKSTITAMIMHVLQQLERDADYVLGGMLAGFDRMVRLRGETIMVIEGDEYLSSRVDPTPKMLHYGGDIVVITGIEWDHVNVFPTLQNYVAQFQKLIDQTLKNGGTLICYEDDQHLDDLLGAHSDRIIRYRKLLQSPQLKVHLEEEDFQLKIFGNHNMANAAAAMEVCQMIGISKKDFLKGLSSFAGVGKRMQQINVDPFVYLDYAHAPSKVRETMKACRLRHQEEYILAVYELHTYSSLNQDFLPNYAHTLEDADEVIVTYSDHAIAMKRLPSLEISQVASAFHHPNITVINDTDLLGEVLRDRMARCDVTLMMSSGNFSGIDVRNLLPKPIRINDIKLP